MTAVIDSPFFSLFLPQTTSLGLVPIIFHVTLNQPVCPLYELFATAPIIFSPKKHFVSIFQSTLGRNVQVIVTCKKQPNGKNSLAENRNKVPLLPLLSFITRWPCLVHETWPCKYSISFETPTWLEGSLISSELYTRKERWEMIGSNWHFVLKILEAPHADRQPDFTRMNV